MSTPRSSVELSLLLPAAMAELQELLSLVHEPSSRVLSDCDLGISY